MIEARFSRIGLHLLGLIWLLCALLAAACAMPPATDPLPSWNDSASKRAILAFVADVTRVGAATYVAPAERIAVFDNDGTLWAEQPAYFQVAFALDRARAMAPLHPEWQARPALKAAIDRDMKAFAETGERGALELVLATHTGVTTDEFSATVSAWMASARHPRFGRPYGELVYQPMLELLGHLRANGFKTYIVSGGSIEFMRPWAERIYGIPPEQVVGTAFSSRFEVRDAGVPALVQEAKIEFFNDGAGKPVGIQRHIGRRPLLAFGNSDGDLQMLQWVAAGAGPRFVGVVRHTDAAREWRYDRDSSIGRLDKALDEAGGRGWTVVDMQRDWARVFPFEPH